MTQRPGFTLIETTLYVVIAGVVAVLLIEGTTLLTDMRRRQEVAAAVSDEASRSLSHIAALVRDEGVVFPDVGESSGSLTTDEGTTVIIVDGVLVHRTATQSLALTSSDVTVSGVSFENLGSLSYDIVRVALTVAYRASASAPAILQYERTYATSVISN